MLFALRSQQRAGKAQAAGFFAEEIVPVEIAGRKGEIVVFDKDEHIRADTTLEALGQAEDAVPRERHRHRRQCVGRQ